MGDIPDWIAERIDSNSTNKLTQQHVVETMLEADRPFFSIRQIQSRIKPDVGQGTVRNRLNELYEVDIVAKEEYPDTIDLYYINHPESNWPIPPEFKKKLDDGEFDVFPSPKELVTFREPDAIKRLATGGWYMAMILFFSGVLLRGFEIPVTIESSNEIITAAVILWIASILMMLAEGTVSKVREHAI